MANEQNNEFLIKYDLTKQICNHVNPHLILPLIDFLSNRELYSEESINRSKLKYLQDTKMIDYCSNLSQLLPDYNKENDEIYSAKRSEIITELMTVQNRCTGINEIFTSEVMEQMSHERDSRALIEKLEKTHDFNMSQLDDLYLYSKILFDIGNYQPSSERLQVLINLLPPNSERHKNALWGRLACDILVQKWDMAIDDLNRLKENIENYPSDHSTIQLTLRTNLLHWALYVFFNHPKGRDMLIDWFLATPANLNAILTVAPHLMRYLTVCVIMNTKRRKTIMKDLLKNINQISYMYSDPIIEFVECLYVHYNFDRAQELLAKCQKILMNDFFLTACDDSFLDNARLLIFETFFRIHNCISLKMISEKLNMNEKEAEKWIVNLIRSANLDAKIDSQQGHVVMGFTPTNVHQHIIDRTKSVFFSTQKVNNLLEKRSGIKAIPDCMI